MTDIPTAEPQKLDDVMLAMDIVDTLRHRSIIVERELGGDAREDSMLRRLKEIYAAQGIEVPERILKDGVKALEENRFTYAPPKNSFSVKLAKFYIGRDRWLKPALAIFGIGALGAGSYQVGVAGPADAAFNRAATNLEAYYRDASDLAQTDFARLRIEDTYGAGKTAKDQEKLTTLQAATSRLKQTRDSLDKELTVRIVSRPGEQSIVWRYPDKNPDQRNYYLIVEAIDSTGKALPIEITSEEDQTTRAVTKWGVRVPESIYDRVRADKLDDEIVQDAVIGTKPKGALKPAYDIRTSGGQILDW
ncbi:MAG: DUF6384 family protein [Pseudomonadota bacterium]